MVRIVPVALFLGILGLVRPAYAEKTGVVLEELIGRNDSGRLTVRYRISGLSWRTLRERGFDPVLRIRVSRRRPASSARELTAVLNEAAGQVSFVLPPTWEDLQGTISFGGTNPRGDVIDRVLVGGVAFASLEPVWVQAPSPAAATGQLPPAQAPEVAWASRPAVIEACMSGFDGDTNEQACLEVVAQAVHDPVPVLEACAMAMDGDENELACLRAAVGSPFVGRGLIEACESTFDGDRNELSCVRLAARAAYAADQVVLTCGGAMAGESNELACVEAVTQAPEDPSRTLEACDRSGGSDASELSCLRAALRLR